MTATTRNATAVSYTQLDVYKGQALGQIDAKSTVVFVMNHRSNMDYVLITWLVSNRAQIS